MTSFPTLTSNGVPLAPERLGELRRSDPTEPIDLLRARLREDGYLWLKGFFDPEEVWAVRERVFRAFAPTGLLKPGTHPRDGVFSGRENPRLSNRVLMEAVRWAAFESFCLQPRLWRFYDALLEGPSYLHKRKIMRHTTPGSRRSTGAHYDLIYLRAGTDRVCSSWIPLGDIPLKMGGLAYLEGSDAAGRALEAEFSRQNASLSPAERISAFNKNMAASGWIAEDLNAVAERFGGRWLLADYEAGDMVVHGAYTVHAATDNEDEAGRLRLSTDIRYQNVRDEIDARWAEHWTLDDML